MSYSLYIHIPFCRSKCPYCGFSSVTDTKNHFIDRYIDAVCREAETRATSIFSGIPRTIYIGGGTPSYIPIKYINQLIEHLKIIDEIPSAEFTIEANPESISTTWLDAIHDKGVNRISIGMQSSDNGILYNLGRIHSAEDSFRAYEITRRAGFENISVDLMFGVPGQTIETWEETLNDIISITPEHVSCYSLGLEEGTEYFHMFESGKLHVPGEDETADMYLLMANMLEHAGYARYEVSNFAKPEMECKHNMSYWDFSPYLGLGASAHSFDGSMRCWNEYNPVAYLEKLNTGENAITGSELSEGVTHYLERMMLSLRTSRGLDLSLLEELSPDKFVLLSRAIDTYMESGHLTFHKTTGNPVLTAKGSVIANEILSELIAEVF